MTPSNLSDNDLHTPAPQQEPNADIKYSALERLDIKFGELIGAIEEKQIDGQLSSKDHGDYELVCYCRSFIKAELEKERRSLPHTPAPEKPRPPCEECIYQSQAAEHILAPEPIIPPVCSCSSYSSCDECIASARDRVNAIKSESVRAATLAARNNTIREMLTYFKFGCPGGSVSPICDMCGANPYCIELRQSTTAGDEHHE